MSGHIDEKSIIEMSAENLASLIKEHNRRYWEDGEPAISDTEYDLLMRRLRELSPAHPLLDAVNTPVVASGGKIRHAKPMLSLDKAYSLDELLAWARKFARSEEEPFLIQPKYDGISASWSGSTLATRGDGFEGEDVTDKLPLIELEAPAWKAPLKDFRQTARGEIVIRDDDFKDIYSRVRNKNGLLYKNSRNAVAGIMGLKEIDGMIAQGSKLTLVSYDLHCWKTTLKEFKDSWQPTLDAIEALPYPMDGLVVKFQDAAYAESLGSTAHHPRGQMAFKFSGVRRRTRLLSVEWSFGKNCLTPVAQVEPVDIGGITIKHATLHNVQNVIEKGLHVGDYVEVERAGDVIPYIVSSEPGESRTPCIPSECPCCKTSLVREGPELRCPNPDCLETRLQLLLAAVRSAGIERLGEPNIRRMMTSLGVRTLKDIFNLSIADIMKLDGFKEKSASNLHKEIQSARQMPDWQTLASLNIKGIGSNIAKSVLSKVTLAELRTMKRDELSSIEGLGPERAAAIEGELSSRSEELDELLHCITLIQTKGGGTGARPTICFTGKMPEKRSHYERLAKGAGFEPVDSVSQDLSLLVAADASESSSKLEKARKSGVKIMSLDEWLASTGNSSPPPQNDEPDLFSLNP